jgi:hypothetical protein
MHITMQIIGKTSAVKGGLFRIKQRLTLLGFKVQHPVTDGLVQASDGKLYIYNPDLWTEYDAVLDMAEAVRANDLHIVSNDVGGIIGKQAALSIVWAMANSKPVIITHKPYFRPNVDRSLIELINRNQKKLIFQNLLKLNNEELKAFIEQLVAEQPKYRLTRAEKTQIKRTVRDLLRDLLHTSRVPY